MQFDLSGLEAFVAVVDCGGFGRQRSSCTRRSRPSATRFESSRSSWGSSCSIGRATVQLTAAGESVLAEGRRVLSQVELVGSWRGSSRRVGSRGLLVIIDGILPLDPILDGLKDTGRRAGPHAHSGQSGVSERSVIPVRARTG